MKTQPFRTLILLTSVGVLLTTISASQGMVGPGPPADFEPVRVDSLPPAGAIAADTFAVAVEESFAYIGVESRLIVVDVSNKNRPRAVGQTFELPGTIHDVVLAAGHVYVAAGRAGLRVIDVSDPTAPREIGAFDTLGRAYGVDVSGNLAYVADHWAGLHVIDISDPAAPALMATVDTEEPALDVFVPREGIGSNNAFVAAEEGGLRVIDILYPGAPVEVGVLYTPGDANGVYVASNDNKAIAYVAAGGAGLRVIDVSDPEFPVEVGAYEPIFARRIFFNDEQDEFVYVTTERDGLQVIDVSEADAPVPVRKKKTVGAAFGVFYANGVAYYADGVGGLVLHKKRSTKSPLFLPLTAKALP